MTSLGIAQGDVLDVRTHSVLGNLHLLWEARHLLWLTAVHVMWPGPWRRLDGRVGLRKLHMGGFIMMLIWTKMGLHGGSTGSLLRRRSLGQTTRTLKVWR
jgi:hypothetical protein